MGTCEMGDGALANLWVSFCGLRPDSGSLDVLYNVLGTKGGGSPARLDHLVEKPAP